MVFSVGTYYTVMKNSHNGSVFAVPNFENIAEDSSKPQLVEQDTKQTHVTFTSDPGGAAGHASPGQECLGHWNQGCSSDAQKEGIEVKSEGVKVEGCKGVLISGCWNREVPLYTEVSSFQGVGIEEFHCIQKWPHFRVLE